MSESYRPSNGTEGMAFIERFCDRCVKSEGDKEKQQSGCEILMLTMMFSLDDPEYPKEWIYDTDDDTCCTAFEVKT